MKDETQKRLDKAERAIEAALVLLGRNDVDFAAGRAYYAMFYVAEALLGEKELRFRKHGAVHAAFGEQFAKPGLIDTKFHRWLLDAFDQRILGDYGVETALTSEDVNTMIAHAREFLREAKKQLEPPS